MSAAQILAGISPALVKRAVVFTHIFVWTQQAEVRNVALSLGERVASVASQVRGYLVMSAHPVPPRRASDPSPGPRRLVKASAAVHPLPLGEGKDRIPSLSPREKVRRQRWDRYVQREMWDTLSYGMRDEIGAERPMAGSPSKSSGQVPSRPSGVNSPGSAAVLLCVLAATLSILLPPSASARTVKDQTGRSVDVPNKPHRLVSLAPNITEIVYALGLGDELVGDTDYCDFPPQAKNKPHVGTMVNPSLERIVALKPDLALGTPEANRRETADQLERLGIPLYGVTASTLAGTLASIEDLGKILGPRFGGEESCGGDASQD